MKYEPELWHSQYQKDGYLVVEDCVDPTTLAMLRSKVENITKDPDNLPGHLRRHLQMERDYIKDQPHYNKDTTPEQAGLAVRNIMELPVFDPAFAELVCYEPLLDILEVIFESSEFLFHNYKCIIKAPRVSSSFRWHRDLPYLQHTTSNLITAMLCLDPMTEENGATVVLPGSHRIPDAQVDMKDMDIAEADLPAGFEKKTVICPAGSAVLFHVNIIHGGGPNRSDIPRRNAIGIWAGPNCHPVTGSRFAYEFMAPRSQDPERQKQVAMTFPKHVSRTAKEAAAAGV